MRALAERPGAGHVSDAFYTSPQRERERGREGEGEGEGESGVIATEKPCGRTFPSLN